MKTSWIIGWISLFGTLVLLDSVVQGASSWSTNVAYWQTLMKPVIANQNNVFTSVFSFAINMGSYFLTFVEMLFLWFPSIWTGSWVIFYFIICLPVSIGMVASIVTILRGVPNY